MQSHDNGKMAAEDHKLTYDLKAPERSSVLKGALKCKLTTKEDFEYKTSIQNGEADVLAMDVKGPFVRKRRDVVLQVKDGIVQPDPEQDVAMVSVLERFGRNGNKSLAFCSGWKLKKEQWLLQQHRMITIWLLWESVQKICLSQQIM